MSEAARRSSHGSLSMTATTASLVRSRSATDSRASAAIACAERWADAQAVGPIALRSLPAPPQPFQPSPARPHGRGHNTWRPEPESVLSPGSGPGSLQPRPHPIAQQKNRASPPGPPPSPHTQSLSPTPHHRVCGARAAAAHRDVADATVTAIATIAVHHLRGHAQPKLCFARLLEATVRHFRVV